MAPIRDLLALLRPTRKEMLLFGCLWLKFMVFFTLVFNEDQANFSLWPLQAEIFRSFLRPLYYSLVILVALSFLNLFARPRKGQAYLVFNVLLSAVLLADLWYYRGLKLFPSFATLAVYRDFSLSLGTILPFLRWFDLALGADLVLLRLASSNLPFEGERDLGRFALQTGTFLGLFMLVAPVASQVIGSKAPRHAFDTHDPVSMATIITPVGYHAVDLASYLVHRGSDVHQLSSEERGRIQGWLDRKEPLLPGPWHGKLAGRNLLVIQIESLEDFVLDRDVNGQMVTPNLNALKRQGLFFSQFHEQVNGGISSDADLLTNTSIYPMRNGPTFCIHPYATFPSLPRILAQHGYDCTAIHPHKGSVWNGTVSLTHLGFAHCLDSGNFDCTESFSQGLSDASYFAQVRPMLAAKKTPFYTFMVTQTSHLPYELPDYARELHLEPGLDQEVMGGYLQSVHYTDNHLGKFLEGLKRDGVLDHTVVVITGDHQGVHKFCNAEIHASKFFQPWWEEPERRIPFLILAPGLQPKEVAIHGGQVDIMPTLLDLLGIDAGDWAKGMMGRNLLSTRQNLSVLTDGSLKGEARDPEVAHHCAEGLQIADLIIRGNYFAGLPSVTARTANDHAKLAQDSGGSGRYLVHPGSLILQGYHLHPAASRP